MGFRIRNERSYFGGHCRSGMNAKYTKRFSTYAIAFLSISVALARRGRGDYWITGMAELELHGHKVLPKWNYTIRPSKTH